ncbi:unnamed protein product [Parascedosporium putredinis]|uniref:NADP-dependent oxidoreductase domain-containing protein n=1 Tax=Parascedosporium putredinis TaxID=1442378 RepID=A0A9P1H7D2_9PEZI|nr:unnamed protein product [Parascedosporium putredinis]CAI7999550.1 unnamed protein product [Parascedosporium putredinis]
MLLFIPPWIRVNASDRAAGSLGSGAHSTLAASTSSASAPAPVSSDSVPHLDNLESKDGNSQHDLAAVKSFLNVSDDPAQDLRMREEKTTKGTCDWLMKLESITNWRDASLETSSSLHWLSGNPGVGKSTLAAHLVRRLQEQNADTCYYFLRRGRRSNQGASGLLRSIAYQMAALHPEVCQDLLELQTWGTVFDRDDVKAIWRKIFTNCILHLQFPRPQFWIIDGLDECIGVEELLSTFAKLDPNARIRILFTSRPLPNLEDIQSRVDHHRSYHHRISVNNTQPDIQQFVDSKLEGLRFNGQDREILSKTVVDEADGVFLRARLILEEATITSSRKGAHRAAAAAADAPMGIERLYERVVRAMAAEGSEYTELTRKILEWATCGIRPLTVDEFRIIPSLQGLDTGVIKRGGPLIEIGANNTVHMIHTTARDMLLDPASPCAFSIDEAQAHEHLALDCFRHLEQAELSVPCLNFGESSKNDFSHYACTAVFEHLAASSSNSEDLLLRVDQFLQTNVLRWLTYLLHKNRDLYHVIQASKNLRTYLDACRSLRLTHRQQYENISLWQVDLLQIVLKYGPQLLEHPSAVSSVLPGLCPTDSAIFKQFGQSSVCLRVLAMGLATGTVEIYDNIHYRELGCLDHGESVKHVRFDESGKHLVSPKGGSVAIAFQDTPLQIWNTESGKLITSCHRRRLSSLDITPSSVRKVLFNPDPDINLIAALYDDKELVLFCGRGKKMSSTKSRDRISTIAMSSDGMKFYSADSQRIKIWEPAAIAYEVVDRPSARADIGSQFSERAPKPAGSTETQVGFELRDASTHPTLPLIHLFGRWGSALFDLRDREQYPLPSSDEPDDWYRLWLWMPRPIKSAVLLGVRKQAIDIYTTDQIMSRGFPTTWDFGGLGLIYSNTWNLFEKMIKVDGSLSRSGRSPQSVTGIEALGLPPPQLAGEEDKAEISATDPLVALDSSVMHSLLGFYGNSVVYLDQQMWVCSIDLAELEAQPEAASLEKVHFFIPEELVAGGNTNSAASPLARPLTLQGGPTTTIIPRLIYGTAWKKAQTQGLVQAALTAGFRDQIHARRGQDLDNLPYDPEAELEEQVRQSVESSLANFAVGAAGGGGGGGDDEAYLDCLVLHSPLPTIPETLRVWQAMATYVPHKVRHLGISNVSLPVLRALCQAAAATQSPHPPFPKPAVVQNRVRAGYYQPDLYAFCRDEGIVFQSFWTLSANPNLLASAAVAAVAEGAGVSSPVALYSVLLGFERFTVLDGTTSQEHMKEDLEGIEKVGVWAAGEGKAVFESSVVQIKEMMGYTS